jgi:parallel beta-helix repeat protein
VVAGRAAVLAVAVWGLMALGPGQALATHVECGDVLTADTTLDSDLIDCPGDGVVIGADGISVDLDGHTIDGETSDGLDDDGVDNGAGHDGVTVEDGVVREFGSGVFLFGATQNRVRGLTLPRGDTIVLSSSNHNEILDNSLSNGGFAIVLAGSNANLVARNTTVDFTDLAIFLTGSDRNALRLNSLRGGQEHGIVVSQGSDRNALIANSASGIASSGLAPGTGITIAGDRNLVAHNTTSRNDFGIALSPSFFPFDGTPALRTRVIRNVTAHNRSAGILVEGGSLGTLLERNVASENLGGEFAFGDGIHVDEHATTIRGNTANRNFDLGIEAVPGVTDGGGNKAAGNGNPAQCTGVACS